MVSSTLFDFHTNILSVEKNTRVQSGFDICQMDLHEKHLFFLPAETIPDSY